MFPTATLQEDKVSYRIFLPQAWIGELSQDQLESQRIQFLRYVQTLTDGHIWHKEPFQLRIEEGNRKGQFYLVGETKVGDCIEDEWLIAFALVNLTRRYKTLLVQISDLDGEFLLIEAADELPSWLGPHNSFNRVFISEGAFHLICEDTQATKLSLDDALTYMQDTTCNTLASSTIQRILRRRMERFPEWIEENLHETKCRVPLSVAQVLYNAPELVSAAVEAFYYRNPSEAVRYCGKMARFSPSEWTDFPVRFTKALYAQLRQQEFHAPKPFTDMMESCCEKTDESAISFSVGMKLACGFELLYSKSENVKTRVDCILQNGISQEQASSLAIQGDRAVFKSEEWMHLAPETLEHTLASAEQRIKGKQTSTTTKNSDGETLDESRQLNEISALFNEFVSNASGLDGVEPTANNAVSLDLKELMKVLECGGMTNNYEEDLFYEEDYEDFRSDSGSDTSSDLADESNSEEKNVLEKEDSAVYDVMMANELQDSAMGKSFNTAENHAKSKTPNNSNNNNDDTEEEHSIPPVDLDLNLVSNLLESVASQEGLSGPVSNLLQEMGFQKHNHSHP